MRVTLGRPRSGRFRGQEGFTMIVTMGALMLGTLLMVAGFVAVQRDSGLNRNDANQKDAYYAAQAGISDYVFHLTQDNNYWTYCTSVPPPSALNFGGSTAKTRPVFGSQSEKYAIELMPANGLPKCDPASAASMVDTASGSFRIRSTGFSGNVQRSIVATFRRPSFLDYVYFTNYETIDPVTYGTFATQAQAQCAQYWRDGRESKAAYTDQNGKKQYCRVISFASGDSVNGPVHTNDQFAICGSPIFGRGIQDSVEVSAPPVGHSVLIDPTTGGSGCSDSANIKGRYATNSAVLPPPPSNSALAAIVQPQFHFTGTVYIVLNGNNVTVTGPPPTNTVLYSGAAPGSINGGNGVLYVSNATSPSCSSAYTPFNVTYTGNTGCGTAYVSGSYSSSLTIATENDVIVNGSITHVGDTMLGLIPNNFVRLYHPCSNGNNLAGSLSSPHIDAAMLALQHSFIVDNYDCGATLGTLTVSGTIGQNFRGPVGLIGSSGYLKSYGYDDRLKYEEPPHFIDPVQAQWKVQRENECSGSSC